MLILYSKSNFEALPTAFLLLNNARIALKQALKQALSWGILDINKHYAAAVTALLLAEFEVPLAL